MYIICGPSPGGILVTMLIEKAWDWWMNRQSDSRKN